MSAATSSARSHCPIRGNHRRSPAQQAAGRQPADITLLAANSGAVAGMVAEHGVGLGFVEGPAPPRGLRSRVVAADRLAVVVRPDHPWARRRSPVRPAEPG